MVLHFPGFLPNVKDDLTQEDKDVACKDTEDLLSQIVTAGEALHTAP